MFVALLLDSQLLSKYYDTWALFRDPDNAEIVKNSLQGLENLKFNYATNAPLLDTWSRHTLELAAILAPNHEKRKSVASRRTVNDAANASLLTIDDTFSDASSFVSESICSTFTDFNQEQGVEVFRSKMNRRRKRATKKAFFIF